MTILVHLSGMKRNENTDKAFAITVYIRGEGTSSKSVAAKRKKYIQETVDEEGASDKM